MLDSSAKVVRTMAPGDFDAVSSLFRQLDALHVERHPRLFQCPPDSLRDGAFLEQILGDERAAVFVAEDVEVVVGFVHVRLVDAPAFPLFVPQVRGMVEAIYVCPERRGGRVATALMAAAESWATERGATGMDLVVYDFNEAAKSAFAAMGFSTLHQKMSKTTGIN